MAAVPKPGSSKGHEEPDLYEQIRAYINSTCTITTPGTIKKRKPQCKASVKKTSSEVGFSPGKTNLKLLLEDEPTCEPQHTSTPKPTRANQRIRKNLNVTRQSNEQCRDLARLPPQDPVIMNPSQPLSSRKSINMKSSQAVSSTKETTFIPPMLLLKNIQNIKNIPQFMLLGCELAKLLKLWCHDLNTSPDEQIKIIVLPNQERCITESLDKSEPERRILNCPGATALSIEGNSASLSHLETVHKNVTVEKSNSVSGNGGDSDISGDGSPMVLFPEGVIPLLTEKITDAEIYGKVDSSSSSDEEELILRDNKECNHITNLGRKLVTIIRVNPNLEELAKNASRDLVRGFCGGRCLGLSPYSDLKWFEKNSQLWPYCPGCYEKGSKEVVILHFWFELVVKDGDKIYEPVCSREYAQKFLGCSRDVFLDKLSVRQAVYSKLQSMISTQEPVYLKMIEVQNCLGVHHRVR